MQEAQIIILCLFNPNRSSQSPLQESLTCVGLGRGTLVGRHQLSPVWTPPCKKDKWTKRDLAQRLSKKKEIKTSKRMLQAPDHVGNLLLLEESHLHQKGAKPATQIRIRRQKGGWDVMRIGINRRLRQKSLRKIREGGRVLGCTASLGHRIPASC